MITSCKNFTFQILSFLLILVLVIVSMVLYYLFSYFLTYLRETLGLDPQTSTSLGQMLIIVIILLLAAGVRLCIDEDGSQDNLEAAMDETTEDIENNPPAYDDVLDKEEKTCPFYSQALNDN